MIKPETKFWNIIKKQTEGMCHWSRIESYTATGIPDLSGAYKGNEAWFELKVLTTRNDKSYPVFRPLQIAWQTLRTQHGGRVYNLVHHPSSHTLNIFGGERAIQIAGNGESWTPDWSSPTPYDWTGIINHILSSKSAHHNEKNIQFSPMIEEK